MKNYCERFFAIEGAKDDEDMNEHSQSVKLEQLAGWQAR